MKSNKINNLINFYIAAEKLKTTLRHSYTSDNSRMESSAEHSWMLCLMALTLFEGIKLEIDQLKILKMLVIHDLAEAITGDIPAFEISERKNQKYKTELDAIEKLVKNLNIKTKKEILKLWHEYEDKKTNEAKVAQLIDKMEAGLQHCIAGVETWDEGDFKHQGAHYALDYSNVGNYIKALRDAIIEISVAKATDAKQIDRLNENIKQIYAQLQSQKYN
jgi:putative hydrolases of HD superfamily